MSTNQRKAIAGNLVEMATGGSWLSQQAALTALGAMGPDAAPAISMLEKLAKSGDKYGSRAAASALAAIRGASGGR